MADIFADEQFQARDSIIEVEDPEIGSIRTFAPIPKFSRTPGEVEFLGPGHGEHNEDVYRGELGMTDEEYAELRRRGSYRCSSPT